MRTKTALALAAILALAGASLAHAEEASRASFKAEAEPICQANTKANEKILKGVREEVKQGKLKPAAAKFALASKALTKAYGELKALPQPPADTARLGKWLSYVKEEASLFMSASKALKAGNKHKAQSYVVKLTHNANLANNEVISFGFHYCKLNPSKFT